MKFKVTVWTKWIERGEVVIEADDRDDAHDIAMELLNDSDPSIEWEPREFCEHDVEEVIRVNEP